MAGSLLNFNDERGKLFEIVIQSAAILAVMWEYRAKIGTVIGGLLQSEEAAQRFVINVLIAFLPLAIIGLLFGKQIKAALFNPITVAITSIVGALFILWAEKRKHTVTVEYGG